MLIWRVLTDNLGKWFANETASGLAKCLAVYAHWAKVYWSIGMVRSEEL